MAHPSWTGYIQLSLVSIPVKAYSAAAPEKDRYPLRQLHEECHSPIHYKKVCPIHGEISNDEIVKGYEYAKDKFVTFEAEELKGMQAGRSRTKAVEIRAFARPDKIEPAFFAGKDYYLVPDGPAGQKPYSLLREVMKKDKLCAVAQVTLGGREELMLLRPLGNLLTMSELDYTSALKSPDQFASEIDDQKINAKELELTKTLVEATSTDEVDLSEYQDVRTDRMREVIEAKLEGKEVVEAPAEEPKVINLMDALKASIAKAKEQHVRQPAAAKRKAAPRKKTARKKTG